MYHVSYILCTPSLQNFVLYFQEKKGVVVDPAQREQQEIAKLDRILLMVRDPPEGKN